MKRKPNLDEAANMAATISVDLMRLAHESGLTPAMRMAMNYLSDRAQSVKESILAAGGKARPVPGTAGALLESIKPRLGRKRK